MILLKRRLESMSGEIELRLSKHERQKSENRDSTFRPSKTLTSLVSVLKS